MDREVAQSVEALNGETWNTNRVANLPETIEIRAHTTRVGVLNLSVNVGVSDADVVVTVVVMPLSSLPLADEVDKNGWSKDFFERVAGSIPELERAPQGTVDERQSFE